MDIPLLEYPDVIRVVQDTVDDTPLFYVSCQTENLGRYLPLIPSDQLREKVMPYAGPPQPWDPYAWGLRWSEIEERLQYYFEPLDICYARRFNKISPHRLDNITGEIYFDDLKPKPYDQPLPWGKNPDTLAKMFDAISDTRKFIFAVAPASGHSNAIMLFIRSPLYIQSPSIAAFIYQENIFREHGFVVIYPNPVLPLSFCASIMGNLLRLLENEVQWQYNAYNFNEYAPKPRRVSPLEKVQWERQHIII